MNTLGVFLITLGVFSITPKVLNSVVESLPAIPVLDSKRQIFVELFGNFLLIRLFGPSFWLKETLAKRWVQKEKEENVAEKLR